MAAPTTAAPTVTHLSRQEVQEAHSELRRALVAGPSEAVLDYAATLADFAANARRTHGTFKQLSPANQLLLAGQRRHLGLHHVGLYAGTRQWEKMERHVRNDATPLVIWYPVGVAHQQQPQAQQPQAQQPQAQQQQPQAQQQPAPPAAQYAARFLPTTVYDYTDTVSEVEGFVEPNWEVPLARGDRSTLDRLAAVSPVPVVMADLGARLDSAERSNGAIRLNSALPMGNQIAALAREIGHHHLGHGHMLAAARNSQRDEALAVCGSEDALTAWLLMKMLGLDETSGNRLDQAVAEYLTSWYDPQTGEDIAGHKRREKLLTTKLDRSLRVAEQVLDSYMNATTTTP